MTYKYFITELIIKYFLNFSEYFISHKHKFHYKKKKKKKTVFCEELKLQSTVL